MKKSIPVQYYRRATLLAPMLLLAMSISLALFLTLVPKSAQAGNWSVAVGVAGGNYRPIAYGPAFGPVYGPAYGGWGNAWNVGWGTGWGNGWGYAAYPFYPPYPLGYAYGPPAAIYAQTVLSEPIVLAAQPQAPVWYFCASTRQYFPYVDGCAEGWQVKQATPPAAQIQGQQKPSGAMRSN